MGAMPITVINCEKIRAASCSSYKSRTTARVTTIPAAPPNPCKTRPAISMPIEAA
jgi:hypothetical protein